MSPAELSAAARSDIAHHLHPYTQLRALEKDGPLVIVKGDGCHVIDEHGQRYLEGMAGLWCASLGFSESRLADAANHQLRLLPYYHSFSGKVPGPVTELVEKLSTWAPTEALRRGRLLFANSGSESNDTAFKLVRYVHNVRGQPQKKKIIARQKGYHGVTAVSASMTGKPYNALFGLPLPGFIHLTCPHHWRFAAAGESEEAFSTRLARELDAPLDGLARLGVRPAWFRAPVGIKHLLLGRALATRDLTYVGWTIRSGDSRLRAPDALVAPAAPRPAAGDFQPSQRCTARLRDFLRQQAGFCKAEASTRGAPKTSWASAQR
mgnify:CR=1 FL=1